jgi:hypothetical protein
MVANRLAIWSVIMWPGSVVGYLDVPLPGRLTDGLVVAPPVTGNRSLDEFGTVEPSPEPAEAEGVGDAGTTEGDASDELAAEQAPTKAADGVEPVESTYDWTPDGAPCAVCGDSVEERWRDADGLVCLECKVW